MQDFNETIDLTFPIVKVKAGTGARLETQLAHEWLGAVMPSSQRHAKFIGVSDQIMGVDRSHLKADQSGTLASRPQYSDPRQCRQLLICQFPKMVIRGLNRAPADLVEVRECGGKCDSTRNMRRSSLKSVRTLFPFRRFVGDSGDHLPTKLVGIHFGKKIRISVENADPGGAAAFVPGKNEKVASDFLNVNRRVAGALRRINECNNTIFSCDRANFFCGVDACQGV